MGVGDGLRLLCWGRGCSQKQKRALCLIASFHISPECLICITEATSDPELQQGLGRRLSGILTSTMPAGALPQGWLINPSHLSLRQSHRIPIATLCSRCFSCSTFWPTRPETGFSMSWHSSSARSRLGWNPTPCDSQTLPVPLDSFFQTPPQAEVHRPEAQEGPRRAPHPVGQPGAEGDRL